MQQRLQSGSRLSRGLRSFSAKPKKTQNGKHPVWQAQACMLSVPLAKCRVVEAHLVPFQQG